MKIFLIFNIILLLFTSVQGQYINDITAAKDDTTIFQQIPLLKIQIEKLLKTEHADTLGIAYYLISDKYYRNERDIDKALHYSTLAEETWKQTNFNSERRVNNFYNTIKYYEASNQNESLISFYLDNFKHIDPSKRLPVYSAAVKKTILALQTIGDNEAALRILNTFLTSIKGEKNINKQLSNLYLEKGYLESELGDYAEAENSYNTAVAYENKMPIEKQSSQRWNVIINQQLILFSETDRFDKAIDLFNNQVHKLDQPTDKARLSTNLGYSMIENGRFEEANIYTRKAYFQSQKLDSSYIETSAQCAQNYAESLMHLDSIDKALRLINKSQQLLLQAKPMQIDTLLNFPNKLLLSDIIFSKSKIFHKLYQKTRASDFRDSSFLHIKILDTLNHSLLENQLFDQSIIGLNKNISTHNRHAVDISYTHKNIEKFIYHAEKNRNLLLLKNIGRENQESPLLDSLNSMEQKERELQYALQNGPQDSLEAILHSLQNQLVLLKTEIKEQSQEDAISIISFDEIKKLLNNKTILYYQYGLDSIYLIKIDNGEIQAKTISSIAQVNTHLESYIPMLQDRHAQFDESLSKLIYSILIPESQTFENEIVIIPDQQLNYLPFESLITGDNSFLIEKAAISYTSSLSLLQKLYDTPNKRVEKINIISPDYKEMKMDDLMASSTKGKMNFNYLIHSKEEVRHLSKLIPTTIIDGIDLDKTEVINQLTRAEAIHFTGHAVMIPGNKRISFLALESDVSNMDNVLTMGEIADLETSAELVFMNACNTGNGNFLEGEGVFDLSRSFFSSGTKSIVSSMWEIDDFSSSRITNSFYEELQKGNTKSEALRIAKLHYLSSARSDRERHPYYWSGLIAMGNVNPISFSRNMAWIFVIAVSFFLLVLFRRQLGQLFT